MDRRGFLKGAFIGASGAGILIAASIPDTKAFVEQVKIGDPVAAATTPLDAAWPDLGEVVFNSAGQAIGVVDSYEVYSYPIDVTRHASTLTDYVADRPYARLHVTTFGYTPARLDRGRA